MTDLGTSLGERGLFLPSASVLDPDTPVRVELNYADGSPALSGDGVVRAVQVSPRGMHLELDWDDACRPILYWVIARATEPAWDVHVEPRPVTEPPPVNANTGDVVAALEDLLEETPAEPVSPPPAEAVAAPPPPEAAPPPLEAPPPLQEAAPPEPAPAMALDLPPPPAAPSPPPPLAAPDLSSDWGGLMPEGVPEEVDLAFEAPVEEDGSPSEDLLLPDELTSTLDMSASDAEPSEDLDDVEPILLEDVVEDSTDLLEEALEEPDDPSQRQSTQYAFSRSAPRDELGPAPAPSDALKAAAIVPPAPAEPAEEDGREPGEVTPLARIELVRQSNSTVRAGDLAPPPPEVANRVPRTAIPNKRSKPPLPAPSRRALGIDPGDQTTRVAIVERGGVRVIPSRRGAAGVPSAVYIDPSGKTIVGEPATRRLPWHPDGGIHGTKRLVGRLFCAPRIGSLKARLPCALGAAEEDEVALSIGPHFISLEEIEALILKEAKAASALALQDEVNRVVLTCPASFGVRQRRALEVSARLAGLHVERVVSSPLAVVLGQLKAGRLAQGRYLVYELGAHFFDASVVQVGARGARLLGSAGDPELGGAEFDAAVADLVLEEMGKLEGAMPDSREGLLDLIDAAELAKCELSGDTHARVRVEHAGVGEGGDFVFEVEVLRADAEARFAPLVRRTLQLTEDALRVANVPGPSLDGVLVVGGQTRAPIVQRELREVFGDRLLDIDPVVAGVEGAAWAAADVDSTAPYELHDRLADAIIFRPRKGTPETLLPAGAWMPGLRRFSHRVEGPKDLHLFLFQGQYGDVEQDEPVAHLILESPMSVPDGACTVELQVELSGSGGLGYSAKVVETGELLAVHEAPELSRAILRHHFGEQSSSSTLTPPHGIYGRLFSAVDGSDEPYN